MRHTLTTIVVAVRQRRLAKQTTSPVPPASPAPPTPPAESSYGPGDADVVWVNDPYGANVIVSVKGPPGRPSQDLSQIPTWWSIYVDLSDTVIADTDALRELESWVDGLEAQGYRLNVSGISPEHPTLQP